MTAFLASRLTHPVRDALVLVGIGRALWFFIVQDQHPWEWPALDARAYWGVDLAHPYANSALGAISAYLYSPAFAQVAAPLSLIPFPVFAAGWSLMLAVICLWLIRPWPWAGLMLCLPIIYEVLIGNVHLLLAAAIVVGFRAPAVWAFGILTKVTPGVGVLWFAVRCEWRAFAWATGTTLAIVAVSWLFAPDAWFEWLAFVTASVSGTGWLVPRLGVAAVLVIFGAATDRPWLVPVAVWFSLPIIHLNAWVILLATVRLYRLPPVTAWGRDETAPVGVGSTA